MSKFLAPLVVGVILILSACGATTAPPAAASSGNSAPSPAPGQTCEMGINCTTPSGLSFPVATVAEVPLAQPSAITEHQWALIAKDPARHVGERVVVFGKVTQFDAATGTSGFRANVGGKRLPVTYGFVNYPSNTMLTGDENGLATLVEGDIFRAEVTVIGPYSYDTQIGGNTTVPALTVTAYKVIGHV